MRANRRADTKPELTLRRLLHRQGLRFRKDMLVVARDLRVKVDVAFTRPRVAVFIDGCFWHGCAEHCRMPASNVAYWQAKIARNRARDARVDAALAAAGWRVVRIWEHMPPAEAAALVSATLGDQCRSRTGIRRAR